MDIADLTWGKFFDHRQRSLWERFPGHYRAQAVEVNDPAAMGRIRFKCPEMHDFDLKAEECPWAVPSFDLGGKKAGKITHPCIGDWVWVTFEKQHPFGPVWTGFATPIKRRYYVLSQIAEKPDPKLDEHNKSPSTLDSKNKPITYINYDEKYLPKDGRPMAYGEQDRYGNLEISSSIGYYPVEHDVDPPPPDIDPVNKNVLGSVLKRPEVNNPDKKFILKTTKYGNILLLGDQGYYWKKDGDYGEFYGDSDKDDKFETDRHLYLQKQINENQPRTDIQGGDQRRVELSTRYGHKIECRDVGWAQPGPKDSKSRKDEYGPPAYLSKEDKNDFRWIKIRTKGGMLFQAYDKGFDPQEDTFVARNRLEEVGASTEQEDKYWSDRDARWIRIVSRHGYKFVIDDRGSDSRSSEKLENPSGNGILIKGRRTASTHGIVKTGAPTGFYWEFNENDETNHSSWGSPTGQNIEINDRYQYIMMSSRLGDNWSASYQGLKENEFIGKPAMSAYKEYGYNPEIASHHLKIDLDNEYIRLKTRANKGYAPNNPVVDSGVDIQELNQGFEARDGQNEDGPWVEIVDSQNRGFWFSKKYQAGIWRSSSDSSMCMCIDDINKKIIIQNNELTGIVDIFAANGINIISGADINMQAVGNIRLKANSVEMSTTATNVQIRDKILTSGPVWASEFQIKPGGLPIASIDKSILPVKLFPSDRAKTYNGPFEIPDRDIIEHKLPTGA